MWSGFAGKHKKSPARSRATKRGRRSQPAFLSEPRSRGTEETGFWEATDESTNCSGSGGSAAEGCCLEAAVLARSWQRSRRSLWRAGEGGKSMGAPLIRHLFA